MKKLTWCLLPFVGFVALACGGESAETADNAPPPAVQSPGNTGPNGELQPPQRAISPDTGPGPGPGTGGNQGGGGGGECEDECAGTSDPLACEDLCECLLDCNGDQTCQSGCLGL